jgi:hypothetical protein
MNSCIAEFNWQVLSTRGIAGAIVQYAERNGVDLIIMASHGRTGFQRWLRGSVARQVQRSTFVPVCIMAISDPAASLDCLSDYLNQVGE